MTIRSTATLVGNKRFTDRLVIGKRVGGYAHLSLRQYPEQLLIIGWSEKLASNVPGSVKVIEEDV